MGNLKKNQKVIFISCGNRQIPSFRYRVYLVSKELKKYKIETKIVQDFIKLIEFKKHLRLFLNIVKEKEKTVVCFQKTLSPLALIVHISFRLCKVKTIFDFDDSIFLNGPFKIGKLFTIIQLKICNYVITGNEYLLKYASKFNINSAVFPTSVKLFKKKEVNRMTSNHKDLTIGWVGTEDNLQYLELVIESVRSLIDKYNIRFLIIGPETPLNYVKKKFKHNCDVMRWKLDTEWENIAKIDIGIMPLFNTSWTQGKCGFKAIQYMSLGIPTVVSPVGVNVQLIKHGVNGFTAKNEKEWIFFLEKLIKSSKLRKEIGNSGRKTIKDDYNIQKNIKVFITVVDLLFSKTHHIKGE